MWVCWVRGPKGRRSRPKGPTAGEGFLRRGSEPPPHQLGGLGNAVSSLSGVRVGALENFEFDAFWDLKIASEQCKNDEFVNWPLIVNHANVHVAMKLYGRVWKYGIPYFTCGYATMLQHTPHTRQRRLCLLLLLLYVEDDGFREAVRKPTAICKLPIPPHHIHW